MMGIVDALKALHKKVTTKDSTGTVISDVINDMVKNWPEGAQGPAGPQGDPGVGIKTITGSIDGSNKLTLQITLTNDSVQTVEGTITPPAAG